MTNDEFRRSVVALVSAYEREKPAEPRTQRPTDLRDALLKLTPREGTVLALRCGLGRRFTDKDVRPMSLAEIAEFCDLPKERIRQMELSALTRILRNLLN